MNQRFSLIFVLAITLFASAPFRFAQATVAEAQGQDASSCANMAKFGAIRAYKAEVGTIQGSDGIQYEATLTGVRGEVASFLVSIYDNNEDGETWTVNYSVVVRKSENRCSLVSVNKQN